MDVTLLAIWILLPLVAAYIAHRKRQRWGIAFFLTAIAPPLGLIAVLLSGHRSDGGKGAGLKARLLYGLLPFWIALTIVLGGSFITKAPEYWNSAPWLLVAAIPASIVTLVLVEIVVLVRRSRQAD